MKPLPKDLVDVVSRVMQGANPVVKESVAKDAAHMARLRTNAYIGDGSEATVNKAHQANIKKHGEKVAKAIHTNADHEAAHNATSVGSAGHKVHNDFVKNHLGGHGSAGHKDYHKHMEKKYMDSISEGYVLTESEVAKSSANLTAHMIDHNIGEGSHAAVKTAHQANIKKHGAEVANAIHANASHEAGHNVGSNGDGNFAAHAKKAHNSFVKTHLGGHGSATHKAYHKHMEANHTSSLSHPEGRGVNENYVLAEEVECVNKPEAEEPTANHGAAEAGNAGDKTPPTQGSSDTTKFYMAPNAQVMHAKEGKGNVLATMGEGVDAVAEVMFKESLKRIPVWELEPVEE